MSDAANMHCMAETQLISEELNYELSLLKLEKILVAPVSVTTVEYSDVSAGTASASEASADAGASTDMTGGSY